MLIINETETGVIQVPNKWQRGRKIYMFLCDQVQIQDKIRSREILSNFYLAFTTGHGN